MTDADFTDTDMSDEELRRPAASRLAVLGQPIAHSMSPAIHRAAYGVLELPWTYDAIECGVADLQAFLESRGPVWRGLSLTMPLKEEARRLALVVDPVAEESGVVNTLFRLTHDSSGVPQWAGFNTDVAGLAAAITGVGLDATRTVIIGSGATAVSAILAARSIGARHIKVLARNAQAVSELVARFDGTAEPGGEPMHMTGTVLGAAEFVGAEFVGAEFADAQYAQTTLVISTLPGTAADAVTLPGELIRVPLFDVAYDPWPSPLAERWRVSGGEAHSGLDMLVEQALVQIRIFINGDPLAPLDDEGALLDVMRAASMGG